MYQSVPSLTILPGDPRATPGDPHVPIARGSGFRPTFFASGGRGFGWETFSTVWKEKCRNFPICFKETGGSLKSRCSGAVSYQFLHIDHFRP